MMGKLLIFLYVVLTASKAVFLSHLLQSVDPMVVLFFTFLMAWVIFLFIALWQGRLLFLVKFVRIHWKSIGWFNLFTAGNWITFFFALKLLAPSAHAVLANTSQPLIALFLPSVVAVSVMGIGRFFYRMGLLFIIVGVVLQMIVIFLGTTPLSHVPLQQAVLGISMSLLCATSMALNRKVNYHLQSKGLRSSDLMCVRFMGLLTLSAIICNQELGFTIESATLLKNHIWQIGLVGLLGVTLPVYLLQKGQTLTDEFSAALVTSFMPLTIFAIQALDSRFTFSLGSIIASIFATLGSISILMTKSKFFAAKKSGVSESIF